MYTEDYENRGFPFRDFLLKLILIIIFVFLLVWLLPKFISPKTVENNNNANKQNNNSSSEISAISSQIFMDNINRMKEAAISYYTDERLPKEVGSYEKMTLKEMIEKKLIIALTDKNNKNCDEEKSYVKITKADDEYILKVNLKDSEKEDYILVHLGCYTYCSTDVCEKKETEILVKGSKTDNTKPIKKPSATEDKEDKKENSKDESNDTPKEEEKEEIPEPIKNYIYEYKKTTGTKFSEWTNWSNWSKTSCETKEIKCDDNSITCLKKLQMYTRKENIGTYNQKYVATYNETVKTGSYTQKACSNYNYVIINNKTYITTTTYNSISNITSSTTSANGWKKVGRASYSNPPRDTATVHYEFVGADYSYCDDTCTSLPNFYYDKWVYSGSLKEVSSTTSTPTGTTTSSTNSTTVTATCNSYTTKEIPIYGTITKSYIASRTEPLYGTVCYQSTKTRKVTDVGKTQYKWSYHNNTNLLNNGWTYTGASKLDS